MGIPSNPISTSVIAGCRRGAIWFSGGKCSCKEKTEFFLVEEGMFFPHQAMSFSRFLKP